MSAEQDWPDSAVILAVLKDFQRQTVDYVYRRMYEDPVPTRRFLVADEVGLGKTLVARGLIARIIEGLRGTAHRIDILYICANRDIARQNLNRLNITDHNEGSMATRLTLLPLQRKRLQGNRINFVSFTPGTAFDLRSRGGIALERAIIYHMLRWGWGFGDAVGPKRLLQNEAGLGLASWERTLASVNGEAIDQDLQRMYIEALAARPQVREQFDGLVRWFAHLNSQPARQLRQEQLELVGELRGVLASTCVHALTPDLVILDEFQRFKDLLDGEDEMAALARQVFTYPDARVLLLSATPYKMYTLYEEIAENDHYRDFLRTARFLMNSDQVDDFEADLTRYRLELLNLGRGKVDGLMAAKSAIESRLRRVMVRTERLAMTAAGDGMLTESRDDLGDLTPSDLKAFALVDRVARLLGAGDAVEYWKSAPYLLNVMDRDGYKLKQEFVQTAAGGPASDALATILAGARDGLLSWDDIRTYRHVDPGNAKLRRLLAATVERGAWQLLWVPPSLPYYTVSKGPYADPALADFTKALIFSAWKVVPKVVAMLASYEAERRMVTALATGTGYTAERARPIEFSIDSGRPAGMAHLTLLYPCWTLAAQIDPLHVAAEMAVDGAPPPVERVERAVAACIQRLLDPILAERVRTGGGQADRRWYWAAMALLDARYALDPVVAWFATDDEKWSWGGMGVSKDEGSNFADHVDLFTQVFWAGLDLGRPPADLVNVLTKVALASPAVVCLRALFRVTGAQHGSEPATRLLAAAARAAMGFRTLYNQPDSIAMIRSLEAVDEDRYWEAVLDYGRLGHLQAVLDEYVHILRESLSLVGKGPEKTADEIGAEIQYAVAIRTVSLAFDEIGAPGDTVPIELTRHKLRCRFALRFGDDWDDETHEETRADQVRSAFNSPFRPFVLASTSIGQEGLDFHQYCHEIYHWNLPGNPVDLEQREGRVNRYKGHVIRRNVARAFALPAVAGQVSPLVDPWELVFEAARARRPAGQNDLVPYWVFETEGGHKVIRHVPALPMSRELEQMERLRRTLVAYRLVFGQPRQEDLLAYLAGRLERDLSWDELVRYRIELSPGARSTGA